MAAYRLCMNVEGWSIIDQATLAPVRLDGVPLASMKSDEAKHMLSILKGIDRVRAASRWWASFAKKKRPPAQRTRIEAPGLGDFEVLRPLTGFRGSGPRRNQ
ncbi:hypothetical protein LPU83_3100 [Rhizobium favelukesii]|uniref:Uncharacterized protein n=1 Tax=Rhizobium favelukesii TaxID=348824 RepID=W6REK9_9HYPH|nr:hypothetical protein LPU83_3100 [Rhizobium favelukesii]